MDKGRRAAELAALDKELRNKVKRRDELSKQIAQLQQRIMELNRRSPLANLGGTEHELSEVGLTEAIRILLQKHGQPMTEADVLCGLNALGFNLSRFKSPPSAIHNALLGMASRRQLQYRGEDKSYELAPR